MRRSLLAALIFATLLVGVNAEAAFELKDEGWEGANGFQQIAIAKLGRERVITPDTLDWSALHPTDGVVLLHPDQDLDFGEASAYLRAGGRLAILDDFGQGWSLLERFQIRPKGPPSGASQVLRQNPNLAVAVPATAATTGQDLPRHPMVANVDQLVTNHPVTLSHPDLTPILMIPGGPSPDSTLAVTGIIAGRGRLFAMGDPSAIINMMLRYPGNRAFAEGLVNYMVENDEGGVERGGRLLLLSNRFYQRGHFGGGSSLSQELGEHARTLQNSVENARINGLPPLLALVLAAVGALVASVWTWNSSTKPYRHLLPRHATPVPLVAQGGIAGRAAVLASPTTDTALALMELKSSLEEGLAWRLGLPGRTDGPAIVAELVRRDILPEAELHALSALMNDFERVSKSLLAGLRVARSGRSLEQTRKRVEAALAAVSRSPPASVVGPRHIPTS